MKTQPPLTKWKVKDEVLDNSSTFGDSIPEQITSGWGLQIQYVGMSCFLFVPTWNLTGIPPYFTIGNRDARATSILLPMAQKPDFQFMVNDIILKAREIGIPLTVQMGLKGGHGDAVG